MVVESMKARMLYSTIPNLETVSDYSIAKHNLRKVQTQIQILCIIPYLDIAFIDKEVTAKDLLPQTLVNP